MSFLPSTVILGGAAVAALALTERRASPPERLEDRLIAARALGVALTLQGIHFAEEAATGFSERLGALFGLPGMPFAFFLFFNISWLGIWIASVPGLRSARPLAFFAAWFLAIAGTFNGVVHPSVAIVSGGYFPGLLTAPLVGVASVRLWIRLRRATDPRRPRLA